jgi:hypothetical protein
VSDEIFVVEVRTGSEWDYEVSRSFADDADEYVDDLATDGLSREDIRVRRFVPAAALEAVTAERDAYAQQFVDACGNAETLRERLDSTTEILAGVTKERDTLRAQLAAVMPLVVSSRSPDADLPPGFTPAK